MHVALAGNFTTSGLVPAIMEHANRYFAAADSLSSLSQPLVTANADTSAADSIVQQLTLTARIFHPPVLRELLPELTRMDTICIDAHFDNRAHALRSEEHTSELQSLMRHSYAVLCLQKKT